MNDKNDFDIDESDELFVSRAKAHFDESVGNLDAATQSRLNQGRHRALAEIARGSGLSRWNQWMPATGVAAAAVFAVVLWRGGQQVQPLVTPTTATDIEILLDQDDFEMLENLEFYSWVDIGDDSGANVG